MDLLKGLAGRVIGNIVNEGMTDEGRLIGFQVP